jgi:tRNA threonylcarbamoyl adenosine modification protein YeaZ
MSDQVVLAIESAISGGSLAIARGGKIIAEWEGIEGELRSEALLSRISEIMGSAGVMISDLAQIAVSNGPGSYTGIRVGIATAIGLAASRGIPCRGVSIMSSVARHAETDGDRAVAVPVGRGNYCWRIFSGSGTDLRGGEISVGSIEELGEFATANLDAAVMAHLEAFQSLGGVFAPAEPPSNILNIGRNLAKIIAQEPDSMDDGLEPFYARKATSAGDNFGKQ